MEKSKETKLVNNLDNKLSFIVDSQVRDFIKTQDISNFSLCVGKEGKIIYQNDFNKYGREYSENFDSNKVYDLGTLSTPLSITSSIMLLINDKLISLDDKISYYIPDFRNTDKQDITIKNLLMHNSGFSSEFDSIGLGWNESQLIKSIINSKLEFKTGTKIQHSILNDVVLQYLIKHMTSENLFDFLNDRLYKPLGMENTFIKKHDNRNYSNNFTGTSVFR